MAIPIEFNLNFSLNSTPIERTFSNVARHLSGISGDVANLSASLGSTLGLAGTHLESDFQTIHSNFATLINETYPGLSEKSSFFAAMQKNMVQDFATGAGSILSTMDLWAEGFDRTSESGLRFAEILKQIKIDKSFGSDFDDLTKNMNKFTEYSAKLDANSFKPFLDWIDKVKEAKTAEEINQLNKEFEQLNKTLKQTEALKNFGKDMLDPFKKMGGIMSGYLSQIAHAIGLYEIFTDAARSHTAAAQQIARFGINQFGQFGEAADASVNRVRQTMSQYNEEVMRVGRETQVSLTAASQAMGELAELRISRSIDELGAMAETTTLMSKAFGVSTGEAAQFARSIVQIGGLSEKDLGTAADQLANVQDEMGLTSQAARATMNQVGLMMRQMTMFGATGEDVRTVTREVGRLASAFEVAGLAADEANAMLNKMMDPSQISENAMLWHGLGMSVADGMAMMTGDVSQMEGMTERMRDLSKQLVSQYGQSPIALQEMARAYGMTFEQVQALSKLTDEDIRKRQEDTDLQNAALAARQGLIDQLQRIWGSLNIILQQTVLPALTFISGLLEKVAGGMKRFSELGEGAGPVLKVILRLVKGIATIVAVGLVANFFKLFKILPGIGKLFGALSGGLGGLVKKAASFVGKFVKAEGPIGKIAAKIAGRGTQAESLGTGAAGGGADALNKTQPEKVSKLGQAFKSMPSPATLLALAVAIVAIGAAVSGIVLSISVLAKTMKDFEWQEMLVFFVGIAAVVAILMWGMVSAIGALGAIGAAAAPGILAAALAIFTLGVAVGIIVLSLAVLVAALSLTDGIFLKLVGLAAGIAIFAVTMAAMAPVMVIAIPIMYALAGALVILGVALVLMGVGLQLIVGAFSTFVGLLSQMSAEQMSAVVSIVGALTASLFTFAVALGVAGVAMLAFGAFTLPFLIAIGIMVIGIVVMALLGRATTRLAENMSMLGNGLQLIAENASIAMAGLANLMSFFQEDQIAALEDFATRFAQQMQKIAQSIMEVQVSVMVGGLMGFVGGLLGKITGGAAGAESVSEDNQMGAVVDQLIESNEHLNEIRRNTSKNIVLMNKLIASTRRIEMGINFDK